MEPKVSDQADELAPVDMNRLIPNLPFNIYRDSQGMNSSGLKEILRSPAHFYQHRFNRVDERTSDDLEFGRLFHFAILEPKLFKEKHLVEPVFQGLTQKGEMSFQSKEAKEKRAEWWASLPTDAIVVKTKWVKQLTGMANNILNHKLISKLLTSGVRETTLWWNDQETGELCKSRPDFVSEKYGIIDLKTTRDAREEYFKRAIMNYNYHLQAGHYLDGARVSGVCRHDAFTFIAIEKEPPYAIAVYPCGRSVLGVGDQWRSKAMKIYARCKKEGRWPGYNEQARMIELPIWAEGADPDEED